MDSSIHNEKKFDLKILQSFSNWWAPKTFLTSAVFFVRPHEMHWAMLESSKELFIIFVKWSDKENDKLCSAVNAAICSSALQIFFLLLDVAKADWIEGCISTALTFCLWAPVKECFTRSFLPGEAFNDIPHALQNARNLGFSDFCNHPLKLGSCSQFEQYVCGCGRFRCMNYYIYLIYHLEKQLLVTFGAINSSSESTIISDSAATPVFSGWSWSIQFCICSVLVEVVASMLVALVTFSNQIIVKNNAKSYCLTKFYRNLPILLKYLSIFYFSEFVMDVCLFTTNF